MNDEIGLVLVSHGYLAREALNSAEMIVGRQDMVKVVSVLPGMDLEQVKVEINEAVNEVNGDKGVMIFTDILGGTPSNAAGVIAVLRKETRLLAGVNMIMLLEFLMNRYEDLDVICNNLCQLGKQGIINFSDSINKTF